MKVKFPLTDELRMQSYYYIQLDKKFCESEGISFPELTFDQRLTAIAAVAFSRYLSQEITCLEMLLDFKKGEENEKKNEVEER